MSELRYYRITLIHACARIERKIVSHSSVRATVIALDGITLPLGPFTLICKPGEFHDCLLNAVPPPPQPRVLPRRSLVHGAQHLVLIAMIAISNTIQRIRSRWLRGGK